GDLGHLERLVVEGPERAQNVLRCSKRLCLAALVRKPLDVRKPVLVLLFQLFLEGLIFLVVDRLGFSRLLKCLQALLLPFLKNFVLGFQPLLQGL
ncbi:hypothetical protein, partial [Rhodovulum sulfidophilum]|uniref:hypothetical protein n=1 Tax=Rhodovulum sulfidophilum TaxID=35806 RepID=UPI001F181EB0